MREERHHDPHGRSRHGKDHHHQHHHPLLCGGGNGYPAGRAHGPDVYKRQPQTIKKSVRDLISISKEIAKEEVRFEKDPESMDEKELKKLIADVEKKMKKAASELNFEAAAELRDKMVDLKKTLEKIKE